MDLLCNQAVTMTVSLTSQVEAVIVPTCLIILLLETPIKHVEQTSQSISVKAIQMLATVWSILWTQSMLRVTAQEKVPIGSCERGGWEEVYYEDSNTGPMGVEFGCNFAGEWLAP